MYLSCFSPSSPGGFPRRHPMLVALGAAIPVTKVPSGAEPTVEQIDELHGTVTQTEQQLMAYFWFLCLTGLLFVHSILFYLLAPSLSLCALF